MATMPLKTWTKYKNLLAQISDKAAEEFRDAVWNANGKFGGVGLANIDNNELVDFAYALVTKYSEASSAAACVFYDELAELSGAILPPSIPAETADISSVAKAVNFSKNEELVSGAISRLVKQAGQDTTLQNALRDGAEFAWIPSGDTCAFCIALASRGWQTASKDAIKGGHAEHIHGHCDCAYAVRFNDRTNYEGYNPDKYKEMYDSADGSNPKDKINSMRREAYAENKEEINEQKRIAYGKRVELLNSSKAEEIRVN